MLYVKLRGWVLSPLMVRYSNAYMQNLFRLQLSRGKLLLKAATRSSCKCKVGTWEVNLAIQSFFGITVENFVSHNGVKSLNARTIQWTSSIAKTGSQWKRWSHLGLAVHLARSHLGCWMNKINPHPLDVHIATLHILCSPSIHCHRHLSRNQSLLNKLR